MTSGETVAADILLNENDVLTFGDISLKIMLYKIYTWHWSCFIVYNKLYQYFIWFKTNQKRKYR